MARINEAELRLYVNAPEGLDVSQFVDDAAVLMEVYFGQAPSFGEPIAKMVEKNLAAHLYLLSVERGGMVAQKIGESSETYARNDSGLTGMGSTRFGQLAISLDTTGVLAGLLNPTKKKAQFRIA